MASHKLQRLMKNLSVDTLQAIPTKDLIDMAKISFLNKNKNRHLHFSKNTFP